MTDAQAIIIGVLIVVSFAVNYLDYLTTIKGLDRGFKEKTPLISWLSAKIGLPLTTFLVSAVVMIVTGAIAVKSFAFAAAVVGGFIVAKAVIVVKNYLLIGK